MACASRSSAASSRPYARSVHSPYHFWMKDMIPLRCHNGNQYLHRKSADYRARVKRKMRAYHAFIQAGVVAQGLLQYLAVVDSQDIEQAEHLVEQGALV